LTDCFFNGALAEGSNPNWFQQARHLSIKNYREKFFENFCVFSLGFEPTVFGGAAGGLPAMLRKAIAGGGRRAERE